MMSAIDYLKELKKAQTGKYAQEWLDEAIEALKQEPCNDTVSRGVFEQVMWERDTAIEQLRELGYGLGQKIEPCEDCVSRTLVLDAVDKWIKCGEWYYSNATDYLFKRMKMLPSVNPTRAHGKWIQKEYWSEGCGMGETYGYYYECSKCGNLKKGGYDRCGVNYCPNCGADMRGEE